MKWFFQDIRLDVQRRSTPERLLASVREKEPEEMDRCIEEIFIAGNGFWKW